MIPKTIHYCWFGGQPLPPKAARCLESWKKHAPDYTLVRHDESNTDLDASPFLRYCYDHKKYAFLSDYLRLKVICDEGGLYFDTDVELLASFDPLLSHRAFYSFETKAMVNTGQGFGAEKGHPTVKAMLDLYDALTPDENGDYPILSCPHYNTEALAAFGLVPNGERQLLKEDTLILPPDAMNPYDDPTGRLTLTENTLSVHWYAKSWLSRGTVLRARLTRPFHRLFGKDCFAFLKKGGKSRE